MIFIKSHKQKNAVITELIEQYLLELLLLIIIVIIITKHHLCEDREVRWFAG